MAELRWTREAAQWLNDIHEYIARDNPGAAGKVVVGIYEKAQLLRKFPELGHKYRSEPEGDIRVLLYGHYRIAYLTRMEGDNELHPQQATGYQQQQKQTERKRSKLRGMTP